MTESACESARESAFESVRPGARSRKARSALQRGAAVALGVALALGCLELGMRQVYWLRSGRDADFGAIPRPGNPVRWWREGHGISHWTEHGIRGRALPATGSRPILAVGDSFTEAFNVDDNDVFTQRLEALLADAGIAVPVLNAGRSGLSPADYVANAQRQRELFAPRWTVVQLRAPDLETEGFDTSKTHFRRAGGGALEVVQIQPPLSRFYPWLLPFRSSSTLVNYGIVRGREFLAATNDEPPLFRAGSATRRSARPAREPQPVAEILELLARSWQNRVTLLFLPDFDLRAPRLVDSESERIFSEQCVQHGWSCVNLRDAFPTFALRFESPYGFPNSGWNQGHMNAAGHAATALLLRDEVARRLSP